ncbi:branched-chain amino acid ABC transporter ATP-binding protein/permease [Dactylosporangium salmoneum]|uniref:Branched-chain amino acid ABC transporter ATP-binding protein/permease n=1 Tax=Dactylosporangium salmoneum TaxID=53361 RepID=A0ABP5SVV4_9ACTN
MIDFGILISPAFLISALITALGGYSQYVVQRAGFFSTAPAAFIAIGAYSSTYAIMTWHLPVVVAVLGAALLTAVTGALLGMLVGRLRGAYVAIATLSVVLVVQQIAMVWTPVTGGALGITNIPVWATLPVLVGLTAAVLVAVTVYEVSRPGRQQAAMRMDEVAAASTGVNVARGGVIASAFSGAIGGVAGAALAGNQFAIEPTGFGFGLVVSLLCAVVVGGYRSPLGPVLGSLVVVGLPLLLSSYALVAGTVVGLLTVLILLFFPRGLAGVIPLTAESVAGAARALLRRGDGTAGEPGEGPSLLARRTGDLSAVSIARAYGSVRAVQDVSLHIRPGQVVGLIGPNGAGKTSVINLLAGVSALDAGDLKLGGRDIARLPSYRLARAGVTRTFQACRLFPEMTVRQNVMMGAISARDRHQRRRLPDEAATTVALRTVGYQGSVHRRADELSYADQRRVEIARALAAEPTFVLLDEPAAGMTAPEADDLGAVLRAISALGIGVLVIDHNVNWVFSICEHVSVQHLGRLIAAGPPDTVRRDKVVIDAYTGTSGSEDLEEDARARR